jgi:hypothetical protein
MAKIHFVRLDDSSIGSEYIEIIERLEKALQACGRPDDKVVLLQHSTWLGSVEIEEAF